MRPGNFEELKVYYSSFNFSGGSRYLESSGEFPYYLDAILNEFQGETPGEDPHWANEPIAD